MSTVERIDERVLHYLAGVSREVMPRFWPKWLPLWRSKEAFYYQLRHAKEALRRCLEARGVDEAAIDDFLRADDEPAYGIAGRRVGSRQD